MADFEVDLDAVRETRALHPERVAELAAARTGRPLLRGNNRLMLVAADHPARGALGVRGVATAMENRTDLMTRLVRALHRPGVDGVLGSPDILEDLLLMGELEDKLVFGSMNRGGLQGASFELDDRFTAYDVPTLRRMRFDGGKMLVRIDLQDQGTARTLEHCAAAVSELAANGMPAMIEPFMAARQGDRVVNDLTAAGVAKSAGIASALGASSAYSWLKLPVVDGMERVMAATTLPTLLLGGDPSTSPDETYATWAKALELPGVRGLVVGRALLFPPDGDVESAVDTAVSLVAES
jgi:DhnA family fructose-bisphosphate aldolase class Ia